MTKEQRDTVEAVAICCMVSANMLDIADNDKPKVNEFNKKQADLLRESARYLRDLLASAQ